MKAIYNTKGEVKVRFQIRDVKNKDWDSFYSQSHSYKLVSDLKNNTTSYGKRIIFMIPLMEGWVDEYEKENRGFRCLVCKDTGLKTIDDHFCNCELGQVARHYYYKQD